MVLLLIDNTGFRIYPIINHVHQREKNTLWYVASNIHYIAIKQLILELDPSNYETTI